MSYTLNEIISHAKYQQYQIGGAKMNLWQAEEKSLDVMPKLMLVDLANEAALAVQNDVKGDLQIQHNSMTAGTEVIALPTNALAVQDVVIYDDANTNTDDDAITSYSARAGTKLTKVASYEALQGDSDNDERDKPERYMIWEQDSVLYIMFNCKPDANYFFDIYYWPIPDTMTASDDRPSLSKTCHALIRDMLIIKVASFLSDRECVAATMQLYIATLAKHRQTLAERYTPAAVLPYTLT